MKQIEEIYRLHATSVYRYLISITSDPSLAEELTQETFYQATKSIHRYNGQCKMYVWLCQIAKHLYLDHLKREKRFNRAVNWEQLEQEHTTNIFELPEEAFRVRSDTAALFRMIEGLPGKQQEVLLLRLIANLSFREIGELMDQTENWARVNFYRAKTKLQERVNDGA